MKEFDYSTVKDHLLYSAGRPLEMIIRDVNYKVKYVGKENIPATGPFILAANHFQFFDPLLVGLGIKGRQVHFMAKKELFENPVAAYFCTRLNAFPIQRGVADMKAMRYACKVLESGRILGIFPEGTRSETGEIGDVKRGIITIAVKTKSDILPAALYNEDGLKKHSKTTVRFGKVIHYEDLGLPERPTKNQLAAAADYVMDTIAALQAMGHGE